MAQFIIVANGEVEDYVICDAWEEAVKHFTDLGYPIRYSNTPDDVCGYELYVDVELPECQI